MTESIAALVAGHAAGKPITATIEETYARIAAHADPALFITLAPQGGGARGRGAHRGRGAGRQAALRRPVRGQGQHRRRRASDHGGLSGLRLYARALGLRRRGPDAGGGDRRRQDQPRPVRDRPRRRPLALWRPAQCAARRSHSGRIELGVGDCGRSGARAVLARHGYRGVGPRPGGAERDRRAETLARRAVGDRRRPGLPHARYDLDLRARRRRRLRRVPGGLGLRRKGRAIPAAFRVLRCRPFRRVCRVGVPRADQLPFFGDAEFGSRLRSRRQERRGARGEAGRIRLRALRRGRPPALRRPLGRRALRRDKAADRDRTRRRCIPSRAQSSRAPRNSTRSRRSRRSTSSPTGGGRRSGPGPASTSCWFRPSRAPIRSPRSKPSLSRSIPGSGPTPTSSTCSISAPSRFPRASAATDCLRA